MSGKSGSSSSGTLLMLTFLGIADMLFDRGVISCSENETLPLPVLGRRAWLALRGGAAMLDLLTGGGAEI